MPPDRVVRTHTVEQPLMIRAGGMNTRVLIPRVDVNIARSLLLADASTPALIRRDGVSIIGKNAPSLRVDAEVMGVGRGGVIGGKKGRGMWSMRDGIDNDERYPYDV